MSRRCRSCGEPHDPYEPCAHSGAGYALPLDPFTRLVMDIFDGQLVPSTGEVVPLEPITPPVKRHTPIKNTRRPRRRRS